MAVKISTAARNDACNAVVDRIDNGSTNSAGHIEIRTAPRPDTPQTAVSGTLLATLNFSNPAFQLQSWNCYSRGLFDMKEWKIQITQNQLP